MGMLSDKIALHLPQNFWMLIKNAYMHGMRIKFDTEQTNPSKIHDSDLTYNLARFGYKELGPEIRQGGDISIEYVIASILLEEDNRRMAATPVLLAKNKANYSLLLKHLPWADFNPSVASPGDELDRSDAIAAEFEEVVICPNTINAEQWMQEKADNHDCKAHAEAVAKARAPRLVNPLKASKKS